MSGFGSHGVEQAMSRCGLPTRLPVQSPCAEFDGQYFSGSSRGPTYGPATLYPGRAVHLCRTH
eukprot:3827694-Prymnesium_polylepis.1